MASGRFDFVWRIDDEPVLLPLGEGGRRPDEGFNWQLVRCLPNGSLTPALSHRERENDSITTKAHAAFTPGAGDMRKFPSSLTSSKRTDMRLLTPLCSIVTP